MAKENILLLVIVLSLAVLPSTGFCYKTIQTTQRIVVIDPGHGGAQKGLISSNGLEEKTIVLKLAEKTAQKLESQYNVLLTRAIDIDISPRERIFMANKNNADLFISIHLHHSNQPAAFFYYFDPPERYNPLTAAPDHTWKSQALVHQSDSKRAVNAFLNIFPSSKNILHVFSNGAPIQLLEGSTMPAILIEPLSILALPQHMDEIEDILDEYARLISKSIDLYFK